MSAIAYVGATQGAARDLVSLSYVNNLLGLNLGQTVVDTLINTTLAPYVTKAYVDSQDALNATKAFIDAGDSTRLKIAQIGVNNGAAGLLASGRIDPSRVATASTQRFPQAFTSPTAYNAAAVTATSTEVTVFTVAVADPGFAYKLLVFGQLDGKTSVDGEYPIVKVHQGTATGQVVAGGFGMAEFYAGGLIAPFTTPGAFTYTPPSWAAFFDVVCLGGGAGGQGGLFFAGQGGGGGAFSTASVAKGSITSITGVVGTGGSAGDGGSPGSAGNGNPSTATATGLSVSGAGGTNSNPFFGGTGTGLSPGNKVLDGATYQGGVAQGTRGQPGNGPGGGGAGGASGPNAGGVGASGAVWVTAFPSSPSTAVPTGPVNVVPTAINAQTVITGATTLYVTVVRSGSASTSTVSTFHPGLFAFPVPA